MLDYQFLVNIEQILFTLTDHDYQKEVVERILAAGADINARTEWGDAPLHYATQNNCYQVVRQLVDKGAMVNKPFQCKSKLHKKYPYIIEL